MRWAVYEAWMGKRPYVVLAKKQNETVISMPKPTLEDNIEKGLKNYRGKNSCLKIAPG